MRRNAATVLCILHQEQAKSVCGGGHNCDNRDQGTITIVHAQLQPQDCLTADCMCVGRGEGIHTLLKAPQASLPVAIEISLPVETNTKGPISIEP